jgi:hypothetical protein
MSICSRPGHIRIRQICLPLVFCPTQSIFNRHLVVQAGRPRPWSMGQPRSFPSRSSVLLLLLLPSTRGARAVHSPQTNFLNGHGRRICLLFPHPLLPTCPIFVLSTVRIRIRRIPELKLSRIRPLVPTFHPRPHPHLFFLHPHLRHHGGSATSGFILASSVSPFIFAPTIFTARRYPGGGDRRRRVPQLAELSVDFLRVQMSRVRRSRRSPHAARQHVGQGSRAFTSADATAALRPARAEDTPTGPCASRLAGGAEVAFTSLHDDFSLQLPRHAGQTRRRAPPPPLRWW